MSTFSKMVEIVPEGTSGNVSVRHIDLSESDSSFTRIRAILHGGDSFVPAGRYAQLLVNGGIMMSDTQMEQRSNREVVWRAHGHVLIAGLGLGMILGPICAKPEVTRVTVIEMNPDVIRLVGPTVPLGVQVIQADIFDWKPEKGQKFDTLYWDIWPQITTDNLPEMVRLNRKFAKAKNPGAWMGAWMQEDLKAQRRSKHNRFGW